MEESAFSQATGLPISMVFEMEQGDLKEFAIRFKGRLREENLEAPLQPLLALNRLYVWPPWQWLTEEEHDRLRAMNEQGDFYLDTDERYGYLRLTHPHLANAIDEAAYKTDEIVRARHLAEAFARGRRGRGIKLHW